MTRRSELRKAYGQGWDSWNAELLVSALASGFEFDDPAMPAPVTAEGIPAYMASWRDRVESLGGTGAIGSRDRVYMDQDGALVSWHCWSFPGTPFEGSAVTRTTDEGVLYERITYRDPRGVASCLAGEIGLVIDMDASRWTGWTDGSCDGSELKYATFFARGETRTSGLIQGILEYPPGARSVPHWHTPIETYYVLNGRGVGWIGPDELHFGPGSAVYVPSRAVHSFENTGDGPLRVLWTLECDGIDDVDFNFVE